MDSVPYSTRAHWMRRAITALSDLHSPCPFAAFSSAIVNHTSPQPSPLGTLICVSMNGVEYQGNPTLHGEIATINECTRALQAPPFNLSAEETLAAWKDLTLYTTGEPCPMCASAIRWAGFRECVWATSIDTLVRQGWGQIHVKSKELFERSHALGTQTKLIGDVLANETDPLFAWPFNSEAPCPTGCERGDSGSCEAV